LCWLQPLTRMTRALMIGSHLQTQGQHVRLHTPSIALP
jgi:hypothetical protein